MPILFQSATAARRILSRVRYLVGDVAPIMLAPKALQILFQKRSHGNDTVRHSFHFPKPLFVEGCIIQDFRCDSCPMNRRIRVQGPYKNFELRFNPRLLLCRCTHDRECAHALAIKTLHSELGIHFDASRLLRYHVLGKTLR